MFRKIISRIRAVEDERRQLPRIVLAAQKLANGLYCPVQIVINHDVIKFILGVQLDTGCFQTPTHDVVGLSATVTQPIAQHVP